MKTPARAISVGFVDHRASIEGLQRRFDLAEVLIDLVGEFLGLGVFRFQPVILDAQGVVAGLLLFGETDCLAGKVTQAGGVAVPP
jgi:hypothetical protein